jgi:hypothetical protein
MAGERPNFIHPEAHPEQTASSRRATDRFGRHGEDYRRSEEEYRRFHESYMRRLEMTHRGLHNLPQTEDRYLDDMTEQDIDEAMSQIEKRWSFFAPQGISDHNSKVLATSL